jgi:hypothetical protein
MSRKYAKKGFYFGLGFHTAGLLLIIVILIILAIFGKKE